MGRVHFHHQPHSNACSVVHSNWSLFFSTVHCLCTSCEYLVQSCNHLIQFRSMHFLVIEIRKVHVVVLRGNLVLFIQKELYSCYAYTAVQLDSFYWFGTQHSCCLSICHESSLMSIFIQINFWETLSRPAVLDILFLVQIVKLFNAGCIRHIVSFLGACCWIQCCNDIRTLCIISGEFYPILRNNTNIFLKMFLYPY